MPKIIVRLMCDAADAYTNTNYNHRTENASLYCVHSYKFKYVSNLDSESLQSGKCYQDSCVSVLDSNRRLQHGTVRKLISSNLRQ